MTATTMEQQKLQLAVAKAAFSATLATPGEPKLPAQLVAKLQSLLSAVTAKPSQRNVKECRIWILEHCSSPKRVTAVVRFIAAYSATLPTFIERLALVYVMNDVLHHATTTLSNTTAFVPSAATQYLPSLLKSTRSAEDARSDRVTKVLKLWTEKAYFNDDELSQIMEKPITTTTEKPVESKPLVQPSMLGRAGDPHWLLPVSCMLEVMEFSNTYKSIPPSSVKPLKLSEKPNPDLLKFVQTFESSLHTYTFQEEDGDEDQIDAEGWNLHFWKDIQSREQRQREERIRQRALETIGRMPGIKGEGNRDPDSVSRSRSPRRRRDRSYSGSPPPSRRRRADSRSSSRSPSPPTTGRSPRPSQYSSRTLRGYQSTVPESSIVPPPYSYGGQSGYQPAAPGYGQPPAPVSSGYFRADVPLAGTSSAGYLGLGSAPTGPSSQGSGRHSAGGDYDRRTSEGHTRNWR